MPLPKLKPGNRVKCRLCGNYFTLEKYKLKAKYCNLCKYGGARRK